MESRSMQRRKATMKGEPQPEFDNKGREMTLKILNGEPKLDMSVVANDVKDYREGFEAGVKLYGEAVRDVTVRADLNVLLEKWMAEGDLKVGFEEFVKERLEKGGVSK